MKVCIVGAGAIGGFIGARLAQVGHAHVSALARAFCSAAMREAADIGGRMGCSIHQSPEDGHAITARLGAFRTSMLKDADAGRPIELDALVGVVQELGQRLVSPPPTSTRCSV